MTVFRGEVGIGRKIRICSAAWEGTSRVRKLTGIEGIDFVRAFVRAPSCHKKTNTWHEFSYKLAQKYENELETIDQENG